MSDGALVTLLIGSSSSRCSACNRNADPAEKAHDMVTMVGEGCGARFTHVANVYSEQGARVREMRPDLIFAGIDDATRPLVAAPPVPPVVPDSDPLGHCSTCNDTGTVVVYEGSNDVSYTYDLPCTDCDEGSGVVPDKPALAPEVYIEAPDHESYQSAYEWTPVPAVTDDEAALAAIGNAIHEWSGCHGDAHDEWCNEYVTGAAPSVVAALRSAGFLIVHPMQRGPEDPTFVMPDITAVHHTKET